MIESRGQNGGSDSAEAIKKLQKQIDGLSGGFDGMDKELKAAEQSVKNLEDEVKKAEAESEAKAQELKAELQKAEATLEAQNEKIMSMLTEEAKKVDADFKQEDAKIDEVLKLLQVNFNNVQANFDKLNSKVDAIALAVEKTSIYASYQVNQDKLRGVRQKYNQFVASPNVLSLQELHDTCKDNDPHLALEWIQRAVVYDQVGVQLISTILEDVEYDRSKLRQWSKVILQDAMEAMYLREACVGVRYAKTANSSMESAVLNMMQVSALDYEIICYEFKKGKF